jgi:hypothetical protein
VTETYEPLGAGRCDATLPVNAVVEEHTFGQFVTLSVGHGQDAAAITMLEASTGTGLALLGRLGVIGGEEEKEQPSKAPVRSKGAKGSGKVMDGHAAVFLPWKQRWELLGYSRGRLVHSLSLAPQEDTTIELFTWDRRKRSLEQESDTETDQTFERTDVVKDTTDVINELTNTNEFQVQADARVKVTYPVVQAEVGGQISNKDAMTQVAKRTAHHLDESTSKAATRVKTRRTTKITESMEAGREERITRKVRNPNMCHALNLDYFEVVANYRVVTEFAEEDAAVCVLIEMPTQIREINLGDPRTARLHEQALRAALLERGLAGGFDAARFLYSREQARRLVCEKVRCAPPVPEPPAGGETAQQQPRQPEVPADVRTALEATRLAASELAAMSNRPLMDAWDNGFEPPAPENVTRFRGWLYWSMVRRMFPRLADVLTDPAPPDVAAMQRIADAVPAASAAVNLGNLDQQIRDRDEVLWVVIHQYAPLNPIEALWWWNTFTAHGALNLNDHGLPRALERFVAAFTRWQRTPVQPPGEEPRREAQQQAQADVDNDRLEYSFPLREVADATERLDALLGHLSLHQSYYRYAILQAMPLGDQMQLLAGGSAPLELCEPRIIGMVQGALGAPDRIAVPLNLGLLDAREEEAGTEGMRRLRKLVEEVVDDLAATPASERTLNMPTSGLMLESRLGQCDACEDYIEQSRQIELDQRRENVRASRAATALQEAEARRYDARLAATPPELDDPSAGADGLRLRIDPVRAVVEPPPRP